MGKHISRRAFLRVAGMTAAGVAAVACQPQTVIVEKEKVVKETVVVEKEKVVKETVVVEKEKVVKETVAVERLVEVTPPPPPSQFSEAPMLADKVSAGGLPPVDDRIPADPLVTKPLGEVGRHGGRLRALTPEPASGTSDDEWIRGNPLADFTPDCRSIVADVVKSWELAADYTELTVYMRRGIKWSDGAPMTTEDVRFWYEDILLNEELTPRINKMYTPGDEIMQLIVDDDYTFRLRFAVSYPLTLDFLTTWSPWSPKHYLKQFHITYNAKANEAAKAEGYEYWWESFQFHGSSGPTQQDVDFPTLLTWIYESQDSAGNRYYARNPYYWEVDTEGNQLPYIDYLDRVLVESGEILVARTLAGEATHSSWFLPLADFPLLKENEAKGNYTATLAIETRASEYGMCFNYTHKDPVLKEMFNDIRWRKAMSHALNRDEINELQFLGIGVPRQPIMDPSASFYEEGIDQYYTEYDPDLANDLLDEMALQWDGDKEWRLRPDGEPITLQLNFYTGMSGGPEISELIKGYWKAVGVDIRIKALDRAFYQTLMQANDHDLGVWAIGGSSEIYSRKNAPIRIRPPWHWPNSAPLGGTEWYNWYDSNGEAGEEPPEIIRGLFDLVDQWLAEARGSEKYLELGREILQINAENVWLIGTIGLVPRATILSNDLRNTPPPGSIVSVEYGVWRPHVPTQWWFAT